MRPPKTPTPETLRAWKRLRESNKRRGELYRRDILAIRARREEEDRRNDDGLANFNLNALTKN